MQNNASIVALTSPGAGKRKASNMLHHSAAYRRITNNVLPT
ncbi:hypothetical protein LT85_0215 [Collimonas arenae]|uniref:Uncharacterized protein n=1 Tax=Collimonas arenae TaxID=279058 RepID=A0A0A1F6E9_9BURK|nr:hypothetical protein LT85_0215 [Collimonas arenae]